MCPKSKPTETILHRIEFQQSERDALEMVAASITARNVTQSVSNLISPFTQASIAGMTFAITIAALVGIVDEGKKNGFFGTDDSGAPISPEDLPPFFFGIIPGSVVYGIRHINWTNLSNEFDNRIRNYNPPSI